LLRLLSRFEVNAGLEALKYTHAIVSELHAVAVFAVVKYNANQGALDKVCAF
jgi:hypothetical protein